MMNNVSVSCCWCGVKMNLGERCASVDCRAQSDRMRAAADKLTASFKAHPLPLRLVPKGMWNISDEQHSREAEAMRSK
jgi:hypothetical protein